MLYKNCDNCSSNSSNSCGLLDYIYCKENNFINWISKTNINIPSSQTKPLIDPSNISTFNWKDLHNKTLLINAYESIDGICVIGKEVDTDHIYLLHLEIIKQGDNK